MFPIPGLPNPWIILGVVLALAGAYAGGDWHGHRAEKLVWQAAVEKQKTEAANTLADATARALTVERENAALRDQMEKEHATHRMALDADYRENRRLVDQLGRLQQPGRGSAGAGPLPSSADAAGQPASAAPGAGQPRSCQALLAEGARLLADVADRADAAAEYGRVGHEWAVAVSPPAPSPSSPR